MPNPSALHPRWTLIRGARQLLTLQGEGGPRRGPAMNKLEVIPNAAVLICDDVVQDMGAAPRIENLAAAKKAVEINASGKIIMPAFVEADGTVLHSGADENSNIPHNLRTSSRRKLRWTGIANSFEYARNGTLTAGLAALFADDLRIALKVLQTQRDLQGRPLRIRPIVCPFAARPGVHEGTLGMMEQIIDKWLPAIKQRKLASIVEIESEGDENGLPFAAMRALALAAADSQFALRFRALHEFCAAVGELAAAAGAVALLTPPRAELLAASSLLQSNTVIVLPATMDLPVSDPEKDASLVRQLIDAGAAVAICMGSPTRNDLTRNMQHALYVACRYFRMSPEEAITAATFNAACSLRTSHATGSLAPDKCADLVIMDVPDYRELVRRPGMSNVELTMRAGTVVYRRQPLILD